ncbi:MAG: putative porin, partial [Bacteroidota bacterium]
MNLYPTYFRILWLGLSLILFISLGESYAQIRPIGGSSSGGFNPSGSNRSFGGTPGGFGQGNAGFTFANPDSTGGDSLQKPKIKPNTRLINRRELFIHLPFSERYRTSYEKVYLWDEIEGRDGFTQSLGQVGKYYLRSYHGLNERFIDQPYHFDPIFGRYNPYMVNPEEQVIYFDTHTPYIRVNYVQGARELQITDVTLSQNITPLWNAVFYLKRRQTEGAYRNFVT